MANRASFWVIHPRSLRWLACALLGSSLITSAHGEGAVVEHEYIPPDPAEDLALGVTTPSGNMPAALRTSSGLVAAPVTYDDPSAPGRAPVYGASERQPQFRIDGHTSDPGTLHYHEPFRPSVAPFKRLQSFDAINEAFELTVRDPTGHGVPRDATPEPSDDEFFGDLVVSGGRNVRIASVASGMRVVAAELSPGVPFELATDSAENWYLSAPSLVGTARLVLRLAVPRAAMAPDVQVDSYSPLQRMMPVVPEVVRQAAAPVLERIGVSRVLAPTDAVRAMVAYFRAFSPSEQHISETSGRELYQRLSLTQRGVCRHRAFAFMVTSLALGIPARLVHNEAHAWVEVFDGRIWHRIDLGGAAPGFQFDGEKPEGAPYRMPTDHYQWPAHAAPASRSTLADPVPAPGAERMIESLSPPGVGSSRMSNAPLPNASVPQRPEERAAEEAARVAPPPSANGTPNASELQRPEERAPEETAPVAPPPSASGTPNVSAATAKSPVPITWTIRGATQVHRGEPVDISGKVGPLRDNCSQIQVDFTLVGERETRELGTVIAEDNGSFHYATHVPTTLPVGSYQVTAVARLTQCQGR